MLHDQSKPSGRYKIEQLRLLNVFLNVVRTIEYAHAQGVIHRDLKPQNIVLGDYGETAILDWGVAKELQDDTDESSDSGSDAGEDSSLHQTRSGAIMGTPAYMSPEQAAGRIEEIDHRSDIFSLGVILYQLLTGLPPFQGKTTDEILEAVRQCEAPRPRSLDGRIVPAVEAICLKAMSKQREHRYGMVGELTSDLERFLADEPVTAWREPVRMRMGRWLKRHRTLLTAGTVAVAVSVVALMVIVVQLVQSNQNLTAANRKTAIREMEANVARHDAQNALGEAAISLYFHSVNLAYGEWGYANLPRARELLDDCPSEPRHWEWYYVKRLCRDRADVTFRGHQNVQFRMRSAVVSPLGNLVASVGENIILWRLDSGEQRLTLDHGPGAYDVAFSPNGKRVVSSGKTGGDGVHDVKVWNAETGEVVSSLHGHTSRIYSVAYGPQGKWIASAGRTIKIWNAVTGQVHQTLEGHTDPVTQIAFSPDGRQIVSASGDSTVRLWSVDSGELVRVFQGHRANAVAFSPDGKWIASAGKDKLVKVWHVSKEMSRSFVGHSHSVESVAFLPP